MVAVVARDEIYEIVESLNNKKYFSLYRLTSKSVSTLVKSIETDDTITHVIIDINGIHSNIDEGLNLMERISKTCPTVRIIAIALDYYEESNIIRDIQELGVSHIITDSLSSLKRRLNEIFLKENIIGGATSCRTTSLVSETEREDVQIIPPPSSVSRNEAKEMYNEIKPPIQKPTSAIMLAVAGGGSRTGVTTQCMQLCHYLRAQEQSVAVVQFFGENSLREYLTVLSDNEVINDEYYRINGIDMFSSGKAIGFAKSNFDYVICDYGNYLELPDVNAFFDKDIKIVVGGVKPWELENMLGIFQVDVDNEINYIFNFAPSYDKKAIIDGMGEKSGGKTFFAPYAPDYWHYSGEDEVYKRLTSVLPIKKKNTSKKDKPFSFPSFFKRGTANE